MVQIETKNHDNFNVELSLKTDGHPHQVVGELIEIAAVVIKTICDITGADATLAMVSVSQAIDRVSENTLVN